MGYSPFYLIGQCFKNIWRNKGMGITSVLVLVACLLVTGSFFAVNENINHNLDHIGELNTILTYVQEDCPDEEIRKLKEDVEKMEGVAHVTLITKEEALKEEMKNLGEEIFKWLEEGENPYRASLEIEYTPDAHVETLEKQLSEISEIDSVVSRSDMASKVTDIKKALSKVFLALMTLLFVVSLFVIVTTVTMSLNARSKEIAIMRYVGSTGGFITIPYILEGILLGAVAAGIAYFLEQYLYSVLFSNLQNEFFGMVTVLPYTDFTPKLLASFFGIGILTGVAGSSISSIRYLSK